MRDVQGVLTVQQGLDLVYLRHWASELAVADLLERALDGRDHDPDGQDDRRY